MAKNEKEIKILNIDVEQIEKELKKINANFKGEKHQKIYTYDIPTIYYRFLEIKDLLQNDNELIFSTNLIKLKTLLVEIEDLIPSKDLKKIYENYKISKLTDILELPKKELLNVLNSQDFQDIVKSMYINPNKWIRLRQSNNQVELTTKHVFDKAKGKLQSVLETEIIVSSLNETNLLLESLGLARRNYQEKIRKSYTFKDAEIEIDIWPLLEPYLEIECENEKTIEEIISLLHLQKYEIVSCNTSALYKNKGIDIQNMPELKFND